MDDREIYAKTDAGREEMRTRAQRLSGALRNVLLLVDGHRTVGQLRELLAGGKTPQDALEQILELGLISLIQAAPPPEPVIVAPPPPSPVTAAEPEPPPAVEPNPARPPVMQSEKAVASPTAAPPSHFERLYNVMNEIVRDYLGLRGYFMQMKIEKCVNAEELIGLQGELGTAIAKIHGGEVAAELMTRIRAAA